MDIQPLPVSFFALNRNDNLCGFGDLRARMGAQKSAPGDVSPPRELADSCKEEPTVIEVTWLPRRFTCARCGRHWWSTLRASRAPFGRRWRGCRKCGPHGGFVWRER